MIEKVTFSRFCDSFSDTYKNNFSYEGKKALFDYLDQYEVESGEPVELDTVALCCEYTEYKNLAELQENYTNIKSLDDLRDHTEVIEFASGFIILNF